MNPNQNDYSQYNQPNNPNNYPQMNNQPNNMNGYQQPMYNQQQMMNQNQPMYNQQQIMNQNQQINNQVSNTNNYPQANNQQNKDDKSKNIKTLIISFAIIIAIVVGIVTIKFTLYKDSSNNNISAASSTDLKNMLEKLPTTFYTNYHFSNYYFIYKDKIYFYAKDSINDALYEMNLDGTNKKLITENKDLEYASFFFAYNDEAYFENLSTNSRITKKINLKTGEITSLPEYKNGFIKESLQNGIAYSYQLNEFEKMDLNTNQILSNKKSYDAKTKDKYILDYDGANTYAIDDFGYGNKLAAIYKNNQIIYEFANYNIQYFPDLTFIAATDNFVYFELESKIYKLNTNTKIIDNIIEVNSKIERIERIKSTDSYFYSNKKIYHLNMENDTIEELIDSVEKKPEYVYSLDNKLVFTENTNNLVYLETDTNRNIGSVIIYDKENKKVERYSNIRKFARDDENIYMIRRENNQYYVDKIKFKNKKDDIKHVIFLYS